MHRAVFAAFPVLLVMLTAGLSANEWPTAVTVSRLPPTLSESATEVPASNAVQQAPIRLSCKHCQLPRPVSCLSLLGKMSR